MTVFTRRLRRAQRWRDWPGEKDGTDSAIVTIAGESDGLLASLSFGHFLVLQLLSAGARISTCALVTLCKHAIRIALFTIAATSRAERRDGADARSVTGELPRFCQLKNTVYELLVDIPRGGHKPVIILIRRDSRLATRRYVGKSAGTELLLLYRRFLPCRR